jgi:hypothetical protein
MISAAIIRESYRRKRDGNIAGNGSSHRHGAIEAGVASEKNSCECKSSAAGHRRVVRFIGCPCPDFDTDAIRDANGYADANRNAHADGYTDADPTALANGHADNNGYAYTNQYGDADNVSVAYRNCDPDNHTLRDAYASRRAQFHIGQSGGTDSPDGHCRVAWRPCDAQELTRRFVRCHSLNS